MLSKKKTMEALGLMRDMYPEAKGELRADTDFHYLIAVILSAQATDVSVNKATPALFESYPDARSLADASLEDVMDLIKTIGLYKNKAKNIIKTAKVISKEYDGKVPQTITELIKLPGVGQKTANVVAGDRFGVPAVAVDTHVERVSKRLYICKQSASVKEVEETLECKIPRELWVTAHHTMIFFGRYHCTAKKSKCEACPLLHLCYAGPKILTKRMEKVKES
ncbi:endonuclease III [Vagococcus vulneris]|uniref:Endonuclease III n=1 Tax=Vagococcus vulneris TaxID=1977869 RepID=A0A429ZWQ0_9ENTE|nr:endonuclease III [Vagococcus vulneris]RST98218.1 endonuclease III [Vagococcus vulneris]